MTSASTDTAPAPIAGLPTQRGFLGKITTVHEYNATSIGRDADGRDVSHELVQVGDDGRIYRSNGCQCFESGTPAYHAMWQARRLSSLTYRIEHDGGRAYKSVLAGIMGERGVNEFVAAATGRRA